MTKVELEIKLKKVNEENSKLKEIYSEKQEELLIQKEEYSKQIKINTTLLEINKELESQNKEISIRNKALEKADQVIKELINKLQNDLNARNKQLSELTIFMTKSLNVRGAKLQSENHLLDLEIEKYNKKFFELQNDIGLENINEREERK